MKAKIAQILLETDSVKLNLKQPFKWTSGISSPIYCDNRRLISFPEHRQVIVEGFVRLIENLPQKPEVIAGTATAAIPWASFVAMRLNLPLLYIRPEPKAYGAGKQIEGAAENFMGKKSIIIEDLISTGGSSLKAAQAMIRELNQRPLGIFAIFQYGFPDTIQLFEKEGYIMDTLCNLDELLDYASSLSYFTDAEIDKIRTFAHNPKLWHP
ncbi:MAG: orotate phosphoribosyltransferase [Bacteroidia bacterium]|nr:orotate phosphoribosyltransferase [Bacteroidia bacterium]MDW8301203.1 orotate phosphoribosyltransferase [Bacteroidia bacterium]